MEHKWMHGATTSLQQCCYRNRKPSSSWSTSFRPIYTGTGRHCSYGRCSINKPLPTQTHPRIYRKVQLPAVATPTRCSQVALARDRPGARPWGAGTGCQECAAATPALLCCTLDCPPGVRPRAFVDFIHGTSPQDQCGHLTSLFLSAPLDYPGFSPSEKGQKKTTKKTTRKLGLQNHKHSYR